MHEMTDKPSSNVTSVAEIVTRRFGRDFDKPCDNPNVLECALWPCQVKDKCARSSFSKAGA